MNSLGKHAVVIGGSLGGLLAGRILSEHYEKVTILDRDELPQEGVARKGVPQGLHCHIMLKAGELLLTKWFPGFYEDLINSGEVTVIDSIDTAYFQHGVWRKRLKTGIQKTLMTRPYLEWNVRSRFRDFPNITIRQQCEVAGLLTNPGGTTVTGVRVRQKDSPGEEQEIFADLVVDASGRGSQTPKWLEALHYTRPEESTVKIDIGYATRLYKLPEGKKVDWQFLTVYPKPPYGRKCGLVQHVDNDRWIVTLSGYVGDYPPDDEAGFLEYARQLDQPHAYEFIKEAIPVSPIKIHRFPFSQRRHYEKLSRFPAGYVVVGDGLCSFNPVHAQGMSITAKSVDVLDQCLKEVAAGQSDWNGLQLRYYTKASEAIDDAWLAALSEDLRYPEVKGDRPMGLKLMNWYVGQMYELSSVDPKVLYQLALVQNLVAKPDSLINRYFMMQVLKWKLPWTSKKAMQTPPGVFR